MSMGILGLVDVSDFLRFSFSLGGGGGRGN